MAELLTLSIQDFCCIETGAVVLSAAGRTLVTGENRDTDASDDNGSGKTTIPKALTWALFEDTLDEDRHDEVIRWGAKKAAVMVTFRVGKDEWLVERTREKGKPDLKLGMISDLVTRQSINYWPGTREEKQAKIVDLLGVDFRAFCNTTLFGESDNSRFYSATDKLKKETLHRLLRSDVFARCEKRLREVEVKNLNAELSKLNLDLITLRASLSEYDLSALESRAAAWDEQREQERQKAADRVLELTKSAKSAASRGRSELAEYENRIAQLEPTAAQAVTIEAAIESLDNDISKLDVEDRKLASEEAKIDALLAKDRASLRLLSGKHCPTCGAGLDEGLPAKHKNDLDANVKLLSERKVFTAERRKAVSKAQYDRRRRLETSENERRTAAKAVTELRTLKTSFERLLGSLESNKQAYKEAAQAALDEARRISETVNPYRESFDKARTRVAELQKEESGLGTLIAKRREELSYYEFWVRGFGSRGLPSLLLDSVMPFLTERTNHYLLTLTDGDITAEFNTTRELKSRNESRDEITITTTVEGVPNVRPSKGQRRKLEISTDLALVDLAATREKPSRLLWLDEVFDGLDNEGESRILRLLRELRSRYGSLFVTSHSARIAEGFDHVICTRKEKTRSQIIEVK